MMLVATVSSSREIELANAADLLELRLDLGNFDFLPKLRYIVTCRRKADGGAYEGSEETRIEKIKIFAEKVNAEFVDIEFDVPDDFLDFKCGIIESYHNFKETPSFEFLRDLVESKRGDYYKIATMGKTMDDWKKIVRLLLEFEDIIAFLMGEEFRFTRIASALLGSPFIYCYVGLKKAPGQIELNEALKILKSLGVRK
ncbi:MAG: 3-dehydroquinate dehydratase [Archaeoglobi archaeon]|jgi:3-dehydroquinate dehydratase-1|nr:MAG: 3-dehydroquinate dehydratase [Archaeoglobi archaeon]TDA28514.1 MAG: 3-dehydroquinate dehydratase [Archaeoglobi archaeon]